MDKQDKYDELDNIINTLDVLVDEISDDYYKDMLNDLKYEAQDKLEEIKKELIKEEEEEERKMNMDFERSRL